MDDVKFWRIIRFEILIEITSYENTDRNNSDASARIYKEEGS